MVCRPSTDPGEAGEAGDAVTRDLRVRPEAEELKAVAEWYEASKPGLGAELVAAVDEALEWTVESPLASPVWRSGVPHRFHAGGAGASSRRSQGAAGGGQLAAWPLLHALSRNVAAAAPDVSCAAATHATA